MIEMTKFSSKNSEIMGFVKIFWKNNVQDAYSPKISNLGQIVSEILAQLCSDDSIQILPSFRPKSNMRLLAANNKSINFLKSFIACENIRFSSLFAAGDVSRGGTSATQRQKFHTDDVKSVRNPVRSAYWSTE